MQAGVVVVVDGLGVVEHRAPPPPLTIDQETSILEGRYPTCPSAIAMAPQFLDPRRESTTSEAAIHHPIPSRQVDFAALTQYEYAPFDFLSQALRPAPRTVIWAAPPNNVAGPFTWSFPVVGGPPTLSFMSDMTFQAMEDSARDHPPSFLFPFNV